jgi:hypothetical protein
MQQTKEDEGSERDGTSSPDLISLRSFIFIGLLHY